ncbi:MAG: LysM peptidoglycan-binding domain-containing protein [Nitrospinales bacterium]
MTKFSSIFLILFFLIGVLFPAHAFTYTNAVNSFGNQSKSTPIKTRKIIYTIKESESLWQIAKYFGIDPVFLAELNRLKNPDLIYPGSKLNIQIQDDFSLKVSEAEEPDNLEIKQVVVQVTEPSQFDIFAPENPLVEVKETISGPRRSESDNSIIFKTLFEFVEWLVGEDKNFTTHKATSQSNFDPPTSSPYNLSNGVNINHALGGGKMITASIICYKSRIPNVSSPPPKSL